ncbi:jg20172 [Pararge aegeria aegeria]|uniref:Jg20172 protein n=1 Tax=Pararge aegeria aegeria TaxID=348720 RepID=A0A8S4S470_9NEOP|nr:jg20172 [Pararge aegeria aegeria]
MFSKACEVHQSALGHHGLMPEPFSIAAEDLCPVIASNGLPIEISFASLQTVKENIVRKPTCLRVLYNVLKGVPRVKSTDPQLASVVDYFLNLSYSERRSVPCNGLMVRVISTLQY